MNMEEHKDLPIPELIPKVEDLISKGNIIHVKFTCLNCGSRQTSQDPNVLHIKPPVDVPHEEMVGDYFCESCKKECYPTKFGIMLITGIRLPK